MSGELEMTKDIKQPLLAGDAEFSVTPEVIARVCHTDAAHADETSEVAPNRLVSSKLILEDFGGYDGIARALKTDLLTGHSGSKEEITKRQAFFGKNAFPPPKIKSIWALIMENFEDPINNILLAAAVVSIAIGLFQDGFPKGLIDGTSIIIALLIIVTVNSVNNYISEKRLAALINSSNVQEVAVHRGSAEDTITIDGRDLVVGDVISFSSGMKVPADCIMLSGQDVLCDEAELTGEPEQQPKVRINEQNALVGDACYMMGKSLIVGGSGKALVLAVGDYTVSGVIEKASSGGGSEVTGLQEKLEAIASKIGNFGILCAGLTFAAMLVRVALEMTGYIPCGCQNITNCVKVDPCSPLTFALTMKNRLWTEILNTFIIAVTVVVVAIPEGLPLAVTIALSFSSAKMRKLNNLVRTLASAETMGGATHICSDKTGTLTQNKMTVMGLHAYGNTYQVPVGTSPTTFAASVKPKLGAANWQTLQDSILYNSSARIEVNTGEDESGPSPAEVPYLTKGNVTEQGIFQFFMNQFNGDEDYNKAEAGKKILDARRELNNIREAEVEFSSSRKRASMVVRHNAGVRVYTKGAPDMLFPRLVGVLDADEGLQELEATAEAPALIGGGEDTNINILNRVIKHFAKQAYRTILVTKKDLTIDEYEALKAENNGFEKESDREVLEQNLEAIGIFGLQDPLRETIIDSIQKVKTAGITTIMCTGDNIDTATAISLNAGIIEEKDIGKKYSCMTGENFRNTVGEIREIPDDEGKMVPSVGNLKVFREVKEELRVLARSSPEDKYLLVTGLQQCDGVVAVTGDGTNDAPALKKADVGFSMGITGTDVAKNASDIVLLDDNFASTIVALAYGRAVYDNVRKFIQFQLAVNVVAMFIVFFGSVIIKDSPLNAVQMLWVNLVMDTLGALSLATEPPAHDVLERAPYAKDNAIITGVMWRNIFGHAFLQIVVLMAVIFLGPTGWLTEPYGVLCVNHNSSGQCDLWNPYYANTLYQTEPSLAAWKKLNLRLNQFEPTALARMQCDHYKSLNPEWAKAHPGPCSSTDETWKNTYSPNDFKFGDPTQKLLHFTFVFQIFVFLQLFNQVNSRKIELDEFNVFNHFFNNFAFILVWVIEWVVQIAMVQVGGQITKCAPLNTSQNLLCLGFGFLSLPWGLVVKLLPLRLFACFSLDDKPIEEEELAKATTSILKKSRTLRGKQINK